MKGFWAVTMQRRRLFYGMALCVVLSVILGLFSLGEDDELDLMAVNDQKVPPPKGEIRLVINVNQRRLWVYSGDQLHKTYPIAVGKSKTPSPVGEWKIVWKDYNWGTGFGTRWMGLNVPWGIYGIHGTNKPWTIGTFASHGCIRMRNRDVEELFEWVPIGTPVRIEGPKIKVERVLKYQMCGPDVVMLQLKLKELGYLAERADGIFGRVTEEAVKKYQADRNLPADGVVTKEIARRLGL